MGVYKVNPDEVYGVVKDNIEACRDTLTLHSDDKYHSCASIDRVPSILKDGLLSKRLQRGVLSLEEELTFKDPFCVNVVDAVSLSTMKPEVPFSQMYRNEDYYNSYFTPVEADFVISSDVNAYSVTTNYFNESLVNDRVSTDYFTGINVRVLRKIISIYNSNSSLEEKMLEC